jgi:Cu(I)/Ag(I) efflux system membrane fusion protein
MTTENTTPETPRPPRPRFGAGALVAVAIASAAIAGGGALLLARRAPAPAGPVEAAKEMYQCPMHPTVVQDHPGDCPICGMKLVKMGPSGGPEHKLLYYRSPMDPKQTSPTPRKDEMGMDYLPVYSDEVAGGAAPIPGLATVNIDPMRQQLIGLETAAVSRGQVGGAWRTVGRVAMDETRVRHINVKIPAYVERIHVDFVGKPVRRGEPLFSIYSPELLSAQEEYLLAVRTRTSLSGAGGPSADGDDLVSSARRKLQLWDVPDQEIARLEKTGQPTKTLTIYSPIAGVVTKKDVVEGMKLDAGAMPYEIVDLSQVWVLADVYENELRHVKVGMPATLTLNAYPNRAFRGRVEFIDPLLDPKTRTVKVRLAFPNPTGELKPEMFGDVVLQGATREGLRIPADAVIDSGTAHVVFVAAGEGKFQPREVELGDSDGRTVEVISGVSEGERVVTRANFLVDSESRLRASLAEMASKQGAAPASPAPAPAAPAAAPAKEAGNAGAHAGHGGRQP